MHVPQPMSVAKGNRTADLAIWMVTLQPMGPVKILVTLTNPELLQLPVFIQEET